MPAIQVRGRIRTTIQPRKKYIIFVEEVGLSPMEAIMGATRQAAEMLNQQDNLGTITEGKLANIIVVNGDPLENTGHLRHVQQVIKDGKFIR